ncbi:unnamed protein product, partial [Choristocarpus tenellus]
SRSLQEKIKLYICRVVGFFLYIGVQGSAWTGIIILTAQADSLVEGLATHLQSLSGLSRASGVIATSIVPAAVTIINAIMPTLIKAITKFEKWDTEESVTYMLTTRMFLAKILNAFIQALSYMLLANPYLLATDNYSHIRQQVGQVFAPSEYSCRLDQASTGLYQLVLTEFIFSKILSYSTMRVMQLRVKFSNKPFVKPEFEVAQRMVSLLYFQ